MNNIAQEMLKNYTINTKLDKENAMKEIIQEMALCGLSRAGFFNKTAFYGGTALRIFYGLDRFSEDLDFSLISKDDMFKLEAYFPTLKKELESFGLNFIIEEKKKTANSKIRSAFLKGNTKEHIMIFYDDEKSLQTNKNSLIKIKFEIDTMPPDYANFENKFRLLPAPYEVKLYDIQSLFAGKIHAVLLRKWKNRTKGRDLYDYVFYLSKNCTYNHKHLCERLYQSGIENARELSVSDIKNMLYKRFDEIDYQAAKKDVEPFIKDISKIDIWKAEFFKSISENLSGSYY